MPLTAIKGAAELLEQGAAEKEESRKKFVGNIRHEVDRMVRMVWELHELTRLDVENLRGQKESVSYCQYLRDVVERFEAGLEGGDVRVVLSVCNEELPVNIVPGRIEQVVTNLLDNAVRYSPPSGVVEITVGVGEDGYVLTSVADQGPGVSFTNAEKVFDRFFTTEPKDVPKEYGSGLGLAIARSIIENHSGSIWLDSDQPVGARFVFSLPAV